MISLQANRYLVYLGRDEENCVTRDENHHYRPPRPPPIHYSTSSHRNDHKKLVSSVPQHVPSRTPLAQSTPRSVMHLPSSTTTTTLTSIHSEHPRQSKFQMISDVSNRSYNYMTSIIEDCFSSCLL